jgi:hypothetical protein
LAERELNEYGMGRIEKALHVLRQAKNRRASVFALITADALEDPQAVMERVGEDMDVSVVPVHKIAVKPDLFSLLHHSFHSLLEILGTRN